MIQIISSQFNSPHLPQLYQWFINEWGEVDAFDKSKYDLPLPSPLLALDGDELVGGLSFTAYDQPNGSEMGLWINALYVHPDQRGQGIASKLIDVAEKTASESHMNELFARTDIPVLYEKIGWKVLSVTCEGTILIKSLPD